MTGKSKDLWASARERLSVVDRRQIVFDRQDNIELLQDVQCLTESARDQSIKKRWRFRRPDSGETIVLRDLFTKIVLWVTLFKQIGDVAVQYDPQHAALPWAGVRFILQVAVSDIVKFNFVVEGIETMSRMISRYAIFEDIYLRRPSVATEELQDALIGLYAAVLLYLSRAKSFFEQSTPKRMIKSVFIAEEEFQELSSQIAIEQSQADRSAAIVDKESHNDMNDTIDALAIDGSQRHAELLSLMHTIDGPITRMSGQVQGLEEHADNSQRTEILSWISTHPYMEHHEQIKKHILSGSGAWLLEDVVYTRWHKESACSLLWLHGKVGSGKSNLAAIVIEDAMKRAEAGQSPPPAYFYCSRNAAEPERSNPDAILASIVRQLSSVQSGFPLLSSIIEKYERKGRGFHSSGLRLEESRDIILELTEQYPMTTIIIDALDEIDSEKRQSLLETIENILQESIGLVKVFVSSRDDQDIVCALEVYPSLNLNSNKNQGDIEQFVRLETEKLVRKKRMLPYSKAKEELKTLIIEQVSHGADGMFRWASLQLEILCTLKLDADVRATLGRLPPKLEQLYLEIYEKQISRYNGEVGRSIISNTLKWLLYAQTRMRSSELCAAVGMNLAISPEDLAKEHILDLCHNFIIFDDGLDTFRFAHLSVREFLETRDEFSPIHCHVFAAEVCLLQLIGSTNSSIAEKFLKDECAIDVSGKTASAAEPLSEGLQNYATIYWSLHCSRIGEHGRESQIRFKKIFQFFLSTDLEGPSPLDAWLLSYRHRNYSDEAPYFLKTALDNYHSPLTTPFFLASAFGFCEVIRTCVMNPKLGLGERKTAWTISAFADQGEALKTLLENRGDLEIPESLVERMASSMDADKFAWLLDQVPDMKYTASLVASVANGLPDTRKEKLDILLHHFGLEKASNEILKAFAPYVTIDTFRTLLGRLDEELISAEVFERAASCQNVEVMTILAERKGFHLTTAAMAVAARECNVQTVQLLLDRGGDSKITNSVIQQAATNGDEKVISLLLDHGGVINLETLTLASALGYAKVLRVLLQRGKAATRSMLRVGARNHRDGGAVMTLLLAEVKHDIIMEEMNELMKQAARNFNYAFEIMAQLLGQHEDITVTEDVLMAAAWSTSTGGPLLRLLLMNGMKTVLTIDVLEAFLTTLTSYDMIQPLLDRIGEIQAGEQLLKRQLETLCLVTSLQNYCSRSFRSLKYRFLSGTQQWQTKAVE